jgi:pimeloyl-ACP methyl ester carboxylesterase
MPITRRTFLQSAALAGLGTAMTGSDSSAVNTDGVKPAPYMPKPEYVKTNGLNMAVYDQGEGTPIVFCHGFPELAFSWRHQMKALSAAGYRCIAPDQRGYGLTGGPEDNSQYDMQFICDDLAGMLDAKGIDKAVFCGHDWGGAVVWAMGRLHPDRCLGIIGLNTPAGRPGHLPPVKQSEESSIIMTPNYYVATFMRPGRAEEVLEKDIRHTFDFILSRGGIWNKEEFAKLPEDSPERQMDLLALIQKEDYKMEAFLPEDVIQYFVDTYTVTGFTGGLNWYRNAMKMGTILKDTPWKIEVPALYVGAEHDVILIPASADGMEDFIPKLEKYLVKDCGHWTQQEKPEETNRVLIAWMNKHFPVK